MTRSVWLLIFGLALYGCGSDTESDVDDDMAWDEDVDDAIETGALSISLPGDHGSGEAMCMINITRASNKDIATAIMMLDVIGEGCDGMGNCENPDMRGGDIMYNGGIDGDKPFATTVLNYETPGATGEEPMWMYNVIFNTSPYSRFDMLVDGESFDLLSSDLQGADDFSQGPHIWDAKISIEADMIKSDGDDQKVAATETRGEFIYEGPCEITARYMQL